MAVLDTAISAALFKENEDGKQRHVFFINKSLANVETRYSRLEQAALALRIAAKKLRPYFQAHPIVVLTDLPLRSTIDKPDLLGRMACWAIELSEYDIQYKIRPSKKGQVLVDFMAELPQSETLLDSLVWYTLNIDGASRQTGVGIGLQLKSPSGDKIEKAIQLKFSASNNESEYEAILAGLELAAALSAGKLLIQSDSQLMVGQVNEELESRDPRMVKYISRVKQLLSSFSVWKLEHIPRDFNEKANALASMASSLPITETIFLPIYYQPVSSIASPQINQVDENPPSWMDPISLYLSTSQLPGERDKAHKLQVQYARFSLVNGQLFKRSLGGPYLKCLTPEQGHYVLAEMHEGICGNHPGDKTLAHSAHTQGYYWPTMRVDAANYTRKCDRCQ